MFKTFLAYLTHPGTQPAREKGRMERKITRPDLIFVDIFHQHIGLYSTIALSVSKVKRVLFHPPSFPP